MIKERENSKKTDAVHNKSVQTYAEDMAKIIQDDRGGLIKKIIHEEEKHEMEKKNLSPEAKKNKFFMFASFLVLFLALGILLFFIISKDVPTIPVETQFIPIVFTDKSAFFEVKGFEKDEIIQTVLSEVRGTLVKQGGVEGIYLTEDKKAIGFRRFMELIKGNFFSGNASGSNFLNDNFLLGAVKGETNNNFFILLKVRSIADVFDSLKAWENKMFSDLHKFFGLSLSADTNYLLTADFEDGIVQNKNTRILYSRDNTGENEIMMMYIFADDTSVIITNTESAAREIMFRLASSQIKQ